MNTGTFILIVGWMIIGWLVLLFFLMLVFKFTPAWTWFKAWYSRKPLICIHYPDGTSQFKLGKKRLGNFSQVKHLGDFELAKGSGSLDLKSKVIWYNALIEHAATVNLYRTAIATELRALGYKIEGWGDLDKLLKAATNDKWVKEKYSALYAKSPKKAEAFKLVVENIRRSDVAIYQAKAYKFSQLYNLFPNDYNPAKVEEHSYLAVQRDRKIRPVDYLIWLTVIMGLILTAAVAYMIIKGQALPEITVKVTSDMLTNASTLVG